ncbi:hypothetical protein ACFYXS_02915 [Streptomyces sp. NPDC002574]|uniref:hypothetical protein n=1 Tax=Streptomyces sp. NPDC002574 TaxID=3364652 RepID=UPI003696F025
MDESLSYTRLFDGARRALQKAMDDHAQREYDEFALHAGVAVERLAKAALVRMNPLYLVEMRNNNTDMLLHFGGNLELARDKVRTIGAKDALARLRKMQVLPADAQLDELIDIRNGVAHTTGSDEAKFLLPTFARAVEQILGHLGQSSQRFWGTWASAVRMGLNERESQVTREIHLRIRQARHRFNQRFEGLPEGARDLVLGAPQPGQGMEIGPMTLPDGTEITIMVASVRCPACTGLASVMMSPTTQSNTGVTLVPTTYLCKICRLELDNYEEIKASGVEIDGMGMPVSMSFSYGPTLMPDEVPEQRAE